MRLILIVLGILPHPRFLTLSKSPIMNSHILHIPIPITNPHKIVNKCPIACSSINNISLTLPQPHFPFVLDTVHNYNLHRKHLILAVINHKNNTYHLCSYPKRGNVRTSFPNNLLGICICPYSSFLNLLSPCRFRLIPLSIVFRFAIL
jgi:hypothetical protein